MAILTVLALAAVVVVEEEGAPRETPVSVPRSGRVILDGTIGETEWRGSAVVKRRDGELLLRHDGKYLYVGVRSARDGMPNVCLARGNSVRVVQGSVARGAATYARKNARGQLPTGNPRHAEMQIPLDEVDARDLRISLVYSLEDAAATAEVASRPDAARQLCGTSRSTFRRVKLR